MRPFDFGSPMPGQEITWLVDAIRQIEQASREPEDAQIAAEDFSATGAFTELETFAPATATTLETARLLGTLLNRLKESK